MIDCNENCDIPKRPDDWGMNQLECILDESINALKSFQKDPTVDRNELISHIRFPDINEVNPIGVFRVSDYTIYRINSLYCLGRSICSPMAIALSYRIVRLLVLCTPMIQIFGKKMMSFYLLKDVCRIFFLHFVILRFYIAFIAMNID